MSSTRNPEVVGFVRTQGEKLVNGLGEEILLRGVGFGSWLLPEGYMWKFPEEGDRPRRIEGMIERLIGAQKAEQFWNTYYDHYVAESDIARITEEGFNSVRVPIHARMLQERDRTQTDKPSYREDRLRLLDRVIKWCEKYRLYVILDLHGAPGGQTGTNIDDSANDQPELFTDSHYQREAVDLWRMLAERYKEEWIVAGYDLLNEPLPNWFSSLNDKVMPLYEKMIAAIREVDHQHMIILEGVHWSTDWSIFEHAFGENPIDSNVLLQFHKYWNNPDTESIATYLNFRERFQVPLFMGEGGENNKEWYAGAFRLFEDHKISWNFWTWKKMENNNSPCSIRQPQGWPLLINYLKGGEQPDETKAERILWEYLANMKLKNCNYHPEVSCAILRHAPVRIPAVFYGYKGEGISYGCDKKQGLSEQLSVDQRDACSTIIESVGFREGDRTAIQYVGSSRTAANFEHGGGESWEQDDWLCLAMTEGDWYVYEFVEPKRTFQSSLMVSLEVDVLTDGCQIVLERNGEEPMLLEVKDKGRHTINDVPLGKLSQGEHALTIRNVGPRLRLIWLALSV